MSKKDEALKLALETSEGIVNADWRKWDELASSAEFERWAKSRANFMATILREALAEQPAQQEPVAWMQNTTAGLYVIDHYDEWHCIPLYKSPPPQRTWVGLTDEEKADLFEGTAPYYNETDYADAIEAKLKEKNT